MNSCLLYPVGIFIVLSLKIPEAISIPGGSGFYGRAGISFKLYFLLFKKDDEQVLLSAGSTRSFWGGVLRKGLFFTA